MQPIRMPVPNAGKLCVNAAAKRKTKAIQRDTDAGLIMALYLWLLTRVQATSCQHGCQLLRFHLHDEVSHEIVTHNVLDPEVNAREPLREGTGCGREAVKPRAFGKVGLAGIAAEDQA